MLSPKKKHKSAKISALALLLALILVLPLSVPGDANTLENLGRDKTLINLPEVSENKTFEPSIETNSYDENKSESTPILQEPDFEEIISPEDLIESEYPDAKIIETKEFSQTYETSEGEFVTRVFGEPLTFTDSKGKTSKFENNLIPEGDHFTNKKSDYDVDLPSGVENNSGQGEGLRIKNGGNELKITPSFGELQNAVTRDNAIRYNNIAEGVDLQYQLSAAKIKEDIIINHPLKEYDFPYKLEGNFVFKQTDSSTVLAYACETEANCKMERPDYILNAPLMIDNDNNESIAVTVDIIDKILTIHADTNWINSPERAFPVKIDPTVFLGDGNMDWGFYEQGWGPDLCQAGPDIPRMWNSYMYVGNADFDLIAYPPECVNTRYADARAYIKINGYDWGSLPDDAIINAHLRAWKYAGNAAEGSLVYPALITTPMPEGEITWNSMRETDHIIPGGTPGCNVEGNLAKWCNFNISAHVRAWRSGSPNYGILLVPIETNDQSAVVFAGPNNPHGGNAQMFLDINWTFPDPIDEDLDLKKPNIKIRPLIKTEGTKGKQNLTSVFIDGLVRPELKVEYSLVDKETDEDEGAGTAKANAKKIYPDSSGFDQTKFTLGYSGILESNWQSKQFKSFTKDTEYIFKATANGTQKLYNCDKVPDDYEKDVTSSPYNCQLADKNGKVDVSNGIPIESSHKIETPEGKSNDSFLVYKFQEQDTIPYVAKHYGVTIEQLLKDNQPRDYLAFPGNTWFIRNPKTTKSYTRPTNLSDDQKKHIIYGNNGRGMKSEFDLEPVNISTGNFYFDSLDAEIKAVNSGFEFRRSYNSIGSKIHSGFGVGWSMDYFGQLSHDENGDIQYLAGDGKRVYFEIVGDNFKTPNGSQLKLETAACSSLGLPSNPYDCYKITDLENEPKTYAFDPFGTLQKIADFKGQSIDITYDSDLKITSITTQTGAKFSFTYNSNNLITAVTLPSGNQNTYAYDSSDRLISFTNADGDKITYEYDANDFMTAWRDGNNRQVIKNTYDDSGRVTSQTDAAGVKSTLTYSANQTAISDTTGLKKVYKLDANLQVTAIDNPKISSFSALAYDANAQVASETDKIGNKTSYQYDQNGNITKRTRADGAYEQITYNSQNLPLTIRDFGGNITTKTYDSRGNVLKIVNPDSSQLVYTYDAYDRPITQTDAGGNLTKIQYNGAPNVSQKTIVTDPRGNTITYYYDKLGNVINEVWPDGSEHRTNYSAASKKTGEWQTGGGFESYKFDHAGNPIEITDSAGAKSTMNYDACNNLLSITNPAGNITKYTYDNKGNKITETDPNGLVTKFEYNNLGLVTAKIFPDNSRESTEYNAAGQITKITDRSGNSTKNTIDKAGNVTAIETPHGKITYEYDANGNQTKETSETGAVSVSKFDRLNRVSQTTDPAGLITNYTYDLNSNLIKTSDNLNRISQKQYDKTGNLTVEIDALNNRTSYKYDAQNRVIEEIDAKNHSTKYAYDLAGNLIKNTKPNGASQKFEYDKAGKKIAEIDALNNKTQFRYSNLGELTAEINPLGGTKTYTYDKSQRLTSETLEMGQKTQYTYDNLNRRILTLDPNGNKSQTKYNTKGQISEKIDAQDYATRMEYDAVGNLTKTIAPNGNTKISKYDAIGQISSEIDQNGETKFKYDKLGREIESTNPAGQIQTSKYDMAGNLIEQKSYNGDVNYYKYDLLGRQIEQSDRTGKITRSFYDELGNLVRQIDPNGAVTKSEFDENGQQIASINSLGIKTKTEFDLLGRATKQFNPDGSYKTSKYDKIGNMIESIDEAGNSSKSVYDLSGRLTKQIDALGDAVEYAYDKNGNQKEVKDQLGFVTYNEYDSLNRLLFSINPLGAATRYAYDPAGNTIKQTDSAGGEIISKYDKNSKLLNQTTAGGLTTYYEYDALGRVIKEWNNRNVRKLSEYDKFDNLIKTSNRLLNGEYAETLNKYDSAHNLISTTSPNGATTKYEYDDLGNQTKITEPTGKEIIHKYNIAGQKIRTEDSSRAPIDYKYDVNGRLIQTKEGLKISKTEYNILGQTEVQIDPMGKSEVTRYDALGRAVAQILVAENGKQKTISKSDYNPKGELVRLTDENGKVTNFKYDAAGNQTQIIYPDGSRIKQYYDNANRLTATIDSLLRCEYFAYNKAGNLRVRTIGQIEGTPNTEKFTDKLPEWLKLIDPQNTHYEYDEMGNQIKTITPEGKIQASIYDSANLLLGETRPNGDRIQYEYDAQNQLIQKSYANKEISPIKYEYNTIGQQISGSDETGKISYSYDKFGQLTQIRNAQNQAINYEYDEYGRTTAVKSAAGNLQYSYDLADRNTSIIDQNNQKTRFEYDDLDPINSMRPKNALHQDGSSSNYLYNNSGKVLQLKNLDKSQKEISKFTYIYDQLGQIIQQEIEDTNGYVKNEYQYDQANQLLRWKTNNGDNEEYKYDANGNRTAIISPSGNTEFKYNRDNQLLSQTKNGETIKFEYDLNGNRTKAGNWAYQYDLENRLTAAYENNLLLMAANYDANGDRISQTYNIGKLGTNPKLEENSKSAEGPNATAKENVNITIGKSNIVSKITPNYPQNGYQYQLPAQILPESLRKNQTFENTSPLNSIWNWFGSATSLFIPIAYGEKTSGFDYKTVSYINDINPESTPYTRNLAEYLPDGRVENVYSYASNSSSPVAINSETLLPDGKGSIAGNYTPWGEPLNYSSANTAQKEYLNPLPSFNSEEYNPKTGLQFLRARYYDPATGTFLTQDNVFGEQNKITSQNLYTYAENNPINKIDPSGHSAQEYADIMANAKKKSLNDVLNLVIGSALQETYDEANPADVNFYTDQAKARVTQILKNYGCTDKEIKKSNAMNLAVKAFAENVKLKVVILPNSGGWDPGDWSEKDYTSWTDNCEFYKCDWDKLTDFEKAMMKVRGDKVALFGDMDWGDKTKKQLIDKLGMKKINFSKHENYHLDKMRRQGKSMSFDGHINIVDDLVDRFASGTGLSYQTNVLDNIVKETLGASLLSRDIADMYRALVRESFKSKKYENFRNAFQKKMDKIDLTKYSYIIGFLSFAVHTWTGVQASTLSFQMSESSYKFTLSFILTDHFGLDDDDLKKEGRIQGFSSWYYLQHYDKYKNKYRPFVTRAMFKKEFSGSIK